MTPELSVALVHLIETVTTIVALGFIFYIVSLFL